VREIFFRLPRAPELIEVTARINPCIPDFFVWLSLSGMRQKAIRLPQWSDVDTADWTLSLRSEEDKNDFGRERAIGGEAREISDRRMPTGRRPHLRGPKPISHSMILRV
jgi:integrase